MKNNFNNKKKQIDATILSQLQQNGKMTNNELSEYLSLSVSPCWRRVTELEKEKVILGYRAILDRKKIGLDVLAFIKIKIDCHSESQAKIFEKEVRELDEVIACYSIGGDADFLLQVVSKDLDTYADFSMNIVRRLTGIKEMQTMFVLKEIKPFSVYPIRL